MSLFELCDCCRDCQLDCFWNEVGDSPQVGSVRRFPGQINGGEKVLLQSRWNLKSAIVWKGLMKKHSFRLSALLLPGESSLVVDGASAAPIIHQHREDPSYFGLHLKSSFFLIGVHVNLAVDLPFLHVELLPRLSSIQCLLYDHSITHSFGPRSSLYCSEFFWSCQSAPV